MKAGKLPPEDVMMEAKILSCPQKSLEMEVPIGVH
jgi:hypothetical protein